MLKLKKQLQRVVVGIAPLQVFTSHFSKKIFFYSDVFLGVSYKNNVIALTGQLNINKRFT